MKKLFNRTAKPLKCATAIACALVLQGLAATAQAQTTAVTPATQATAPAKPAPSPTDPRYVWDLTGLYANDAAWDAERIAVLAEIPQLAALKGTLNTATGLRAALDRISAQTQRWRRLAVYASTQQSTDNRDARNQERAGLMRALGGRFSAAVSWVSPEVQALGRDTVESFLRAEPGLINHAVGLRDTLRRAPHTLGAEAEGAIASLSPVINAPSNTRTLLATTDTVWPTLMVDGQSVKVNETGYQKLREHPDRAVRKQAFDAFFKVLGQYENTYGSTLSARVEAGVVNARLRKHPSAVAASLSGNEIPEAVYRTLVAQANAALPTLHRYFKLRQKLLKLPDLHYYDVYPELINIQRSYSADVSAELTLAATKPLGDEYQGLLTQALSMRSMHTYPADGKSSGAYQTGVYGMVPFVFLNHQDNYASLTTYAHEWGHGGHTMLANKYQPPETAGYSLFVAEVASMTNEALLGDHMLKTSKSPAERLFYLSESLERLRGGFFRQTMFAEFELATHDALERGEALSGKKLTQLYCGLLRKYHGADAGVMQIDPQYCQEWAFIPHFYRPFYVYVYATSIVGATAFGERILTGNTQQRETFLNVLRAGGSVPPYQLLKNAGLDLATPQPYQALNQRMTAIMDEIETLLAAKML
ncbi:MAG: oligoendopeptidase F family protein [Rhodoferax sp.]|nr:oligoendopeptidase F family protein [Rhodoferax sp.]